MRKPAVKEPSSSKVYDLESGDIGEWNGNSHDCQMEGCRGLRISVKWADGKWTYPCTRGMVYQNRKALGKAHGIEVEAGSWVIPRQGRKQNLVAQRNGAEMPELIVDENYINGNIVGIYWEGSPGVPVHETTVRHAHAIADGVNKSDHQEDFFCPTCGKLLASISEHQHTRFDMDAMGGNFEPDTINIKYSYFCTKCAAQIPDNQAERLGVI